MFFALWPGRDVRARLAAQAAESAGRPVAADGYHMTLAFVGAVEADVRCVLEAGAAGVSEEAFVCVLDEMAWLGAGDIAALAPSHPPPLLLRLAERLQRVVAVATGQVPAHRYRPHVTLARLGARDPRWSPPPAEPVRWAVADYVLCRSRREPPGIYDVLARWPLS
ncbi:2'-5' RNA ligase family protein [Acidiferrobacter thiooxydans]|uniref:2'-5' RNA ligase family protein n=1 Tax=Acidiferrobacter thiooxydans TaxID=163359 RepID=UPI0008263B90|nr:2'-5' RNA ligase family protein [Acidiferrobacter thiooxydans]UEO00560.1 2'-5' RNA ligase family protein [Acidiferrobacter thiooxydans]